MYHIFLMILVYILHDKLSMQLLHSNIFLALELILHTLANAMSGKPWANLRNALGPSIMIIYLCEENIPKFSKL